MTSRAAAIREAEWPGDVPVARTLLRNYADHLASSPGGAANICIDGFDRELGEIETVWALPNGILLLALLDERPAGCVAVKVRHDRPGACEMKRLWVEPHARGHGLGRRLSTAAIDWSRSFGANLLMLDTVPAAMPQAAALYRSMGFSATERHNNNPVEGLHFMRLSLR